MSLPLLSAKLIELRHQKEYSQQDIADFLGVTREAYSHYERSTREPNLEIILKLAKFYQIEISELINETTIPLAPIKAVPTGAVLSAVPLSIDLKTPTLSKNIHHFLKLFSGKNINIDYSSITKEDLSILAQYKALDKQSQKEVKDFIKFKHLQNKKNDTAD